jgi:sulfotransferase
MDRIENIYFIAGLPRSGSTLLSAILRQNQKIHAAMSSPVEHIFSSAITSMSAQNHFFRFISDVQRERILRNIIESYYADVTSPYIFDTNRDWPARLHVLMRIFPEAKVVCCVRDIVSVVNSFEHLVANNPYMVSRIFGFDAKMTVYGRFERLMHADGPVGRAINALKEGYYGPYSNRLLFVEYNALTSKPAATIASIYQALGIPSFTHDFNKLSYQESAFDMNLGLRDMHTVRTTISPIARPLILPEDIVEKLRGMEFWTKPRSS